MELSYFCYLRAFLQEVKYIFNLSHNSISPTLTLQANFIHGNSPIVFNGTTHRNEIIFMHSLE